MAAVKQAVARDDLASVRQAIDGLQSASHAMAETLYRAGSQTAGSGDGPSADVRDGDVVDAEVVESR